MQSRTLGQLLSEPCVARAWHCSQVVNRRAPAGSTQCARAVRRRSPQARGRWGRHRMEPVAARLRSRFSNDRRARPYGEDHVVDVEGARSGACRAGRAAAVPAVLCVGAVLADRCAWPLPLRCGRAATAREAACAGACQSRALERPTRRRALSCAGAFRAVASRSRARCSHGASARRDDLRSYSDVVATAGGDERVDAVALEAGVRLRQACNESACR